MKIQNYFEELLRERLANSECVVLYDPDDRYREVCLGLSSDECRVIDRTASTIQGREGAMDAWLGLGKAVQGKRQLLVYVPKGKPLTEDDKQTDPFQIAALGGDVFPRGDGDSYLSLCLQAKPDFQDKLYALFEDGSPPSFETVDALDSGSTWPKLRTLLGVESPREILVALLSPSESQEAALISDKSWLNEYRKFAAETLGLQSHVKVGGWEDTREELGRFVLFSEFALDFNTHED